MPEDQLDQSNPVGSNTTSKKGDQTFLRSSVLLLLWHILVVIVVLILLNYISYLGDTYKAGDGLLINLSNIFDISLFLVPASIVLFVIELIIIYFASKSTKASRIYLAEVVVVAVGLSVLTYWGNTQPCGAHSCIRGLFLLLALVSWIVLASTAPILYLFSLGEKEDLLKSGKFWLSGVAVLIGVVVLWFISTSYLRAEYASERAKVRSEIQQMYNDPNFPIFQPTYLPPPVGEINQEYVDERYTSDQIEYIQYIRRYDYGSTAGDSFSIIVSKPLILKSEAEYFQNDFNDFTKDQKKYRFNKSRSYSAESFTVNGYPVIILDDWGISTLYLYRDGVRVGISTGFILDQTTKQLSQEELVNVAESLERVDQ